MDTGSLRRDLEIGYEQALQRIPDALKSEGFGVLTEIDVKATLRKKLDVDFRKYKILGACNPTLAHQALQASLDVGVLLPCNVVVYENDDGNATVLAVDPIQTLGADAQEMANVAALVREKLARVLERL